MFLRILKTVFIILAIQILINTNIHAIANVNANTPINTSIDISMDTSSHIFVADSQYISVLTVFQY